MTDLTKPITRRIGRLVVRICPDGVEIRGFHKHIWRMISWARLAAIADDQGPLTVALEETVGKKVLQEIGALNAIAKEKTT